MACKYCTNPKHPAKRPVPLYFDGVGAPIVAVRADELEVRYYERRLLREKRIIDRKHINYCPMCGRKLGGDA